VSSLRYSSDRKKLVLLAREAGFSDREIMQQLLRGIAGITERKKTLLDWADALEMEPNEVLREATRYALIPNPQLPKS
jgi:hypothetical protein